jgi:hypothetical protein
MDDAREQLLDDVREFHHEDMNIIWGHPKSSRRWLRRSPEEEVDVAPMFQRSVEWFWRLFNAGR